MLKWSQIEEMAAAGVEFGGHTRTHPRLIDLTPDLAGAEIRDGKREIEDRLGRAVRYFAYPHGLLNNEVRNIVEESGFSLACSTRSGFNRRNTDPYVLHRIEVYGTDPLWKLHQKLAFGINDASLAFPAAYYSKRAVTRLKQWLR
jgi:peptidoglycan/xylan/chitin deacetylase (PgdA/CDA1 family)